MASHYSVFSTQYEESRKRKSSDRLIVRKVYRYAKGYRRNLAIGVAAIVLSSLTGLASPYLHKIAIDQIILAMNLSGFIWWVPLFVVITLANYVLQYVQVYQMRIVGENVVAKMRDDMMAKQQVISLRYFSEGEIGRIMSRLINDANTVRIFIRQGLTQILVDTTSILGSLIVVFLLDVKLATIAVAILPFAVVVGWFLGSYSRKAYRRSLSALAGLTGRIQEDLAGIKVIKSFVHEKKARSQFEIKQDQAVDANLRAMKVSTLYSPTVMLMRIIGTALILWYGALMIRTGELTIGTLVAFIEYQFAYFTPLIDLTTVYDQYQSAMAGLERMFDLAETKVEVTNPQVGEEIKVPTIETLAFDNVTFGYDPANPVIHGISFKLEKNKRLAIVGPTGAGKSTIINLLSRFYNPTNGRITVNGYDVNKISIESLREKISVVLQDSFLFPMSVKDNIRFGKPEASDEEIVEAARAVGAHEFIMKLPGGYDHIVEEGSSNISIGQRQLISFARSLLMNPRLLILDEATSSIDPYTELVVQKALTKLLEKRMAIIIAHRLSTIRLCDEIIVIDNGVIVERGSHKDLMRRNGLYSSFYRMQFREEKGVDVQVETPILPIIERQWLITSTRRRLARPPFTSKPTRRQYAAS